jgi:hypothetical protein
MCKAAMLNVIRKMTQTDGIIAAGFKHKEDELHVACRGLPRDEAAIMAAVVGMLDLIQDNPLTWERSVAPPRAMLKLDIGEESWNAGRQDGVTLILVSVKGHPVAKSLKRMLRTAFKKAAKAMNQPAPATLRVLPTPIVSLNDPEPGVPSVVSDPKTTKLDTST